jgi:hypothetical protein
MTKLALRPSRPSARPGLLQNVPSLMGENALVDFNWVRLRRLPSAPPPRPPLSHVRVRENSTPEADLDPVLRPESRQIRP